MKSKKSSGKGKPVGKRAGKDLPARKDRGVKGGTMVSNVMKARADAGNSIVQNLKA